MRNPMSITELMVPFWPQAKTPTEQLGQRDYGNSGLSCDSMWMGFRALPKPGVDVYEHSQTFRVWQDIGLNMWINNNRYMLLEFRAHEVFSADLNDLDILVHRLKWAQKKLEPFAKDVTLDNLPVRLAGLFAAMGITERIEYRPMVHNDTRGSAELVIITAVTEMVRRWHRIPKREAA